MPTFLCILRLHSSCQICIAAAVFEIVVDLRSFDSKSPNQLENYATYVVSTVLLRNYTLKLSPQPQLPFEFGFVNVNSEDRGDST